ncbi:hypothetical protein VTO42DRAFT_7562 [Malbranchea cinnamomea]
MALTAAQAYMGPAFGCEHLRELLESDNSAAGRFYKSLVRLDKDPKWNSENLDGREHGKRHGLAASGRVFSLKPYFQCLECPVACSRAGRREHHKKTQHIFFLESRKRAIFCQRCDDVVYDDYLEKTMIKPSLPATKTAKKRKLDDVVSTISTNTNKRQCAKEGVRGLFNLGHTCYMNVILQTLFHEPLLTAYFLGGQGHRTAECRDMYCFGCSIAEAFAEFNNDEKEEGFGVSNLLMCTWQANADLAGYRQQDAHEYYQFLVNQLHGSADSCTEDWGEKCGCFFHRAFFGTLRSTVTCNQCGNSSRTEDPIMDLSLAFQIQRKKKVLGAPDAAPTLDGCLASYTAEEQLSPTDYTCSECGAKGATKQLKLKKLPVILCMQLKRFDTSRAVSEKVDTKVSFPLAINMLPYTTRPWSRDKSDYDYDLLSVVVHLGDIDSGHYLAYCRQGEQWFKFNDDRVTLVDEIEVMGADAYLLFYTLHSFAVSE